MSAIIYRITNTVNGKVYIGFTTKTLEQRWKQHLKGASWKKSDGEYRHSPLFYRAIRKYGKDVWHREVIVEEPDDRWALNVLEPFLIDHYDSANPDKGYNGTLGGDGGTLNEEGRRKISEFRKGKKLPKETRQKMSDSRKGEKNPNWGKKHSEETRRKISETKKGRKLPPQSEEHRQKIGNAQRGEKHHFWGKKHSEESKRKISESLTSRKISEARKNPRCPT